VAKEIDRVGGKVRRVVLDYELKQELYKKLSRVPPDKDLAYERIRLASVYDLKVVNDKIPIPDLRIEYEDDCRESIASTSRSLHATTDHRVWVKRPKQNSTCSLGSKTTQNCGVSSTSRRSAQGSSPYENPTHSY
jgi:hypothetical protein